MERCQTYNFFRYIWRHIIANWHGVNINYTKKFDTAIKFTEDMNFNLDSNLDSKKVFDEENSSIGELINEISGLVAQEVKSYKNYGFEQPIMRFGGDCGNVHKSVIEFIKKHYKINANLTIGEIKINNNTYFSFNQDKCTQWLNGKKPEVFDAHTWITINNDYILDLTIGTYINTRIAPNKESNSKCEFFGGIFHGKHGMLKYKAFDKLKNIEPKNTNLIYSPVILGSSALLTLAPRQP